MKDLTRPEGPRTIRILSAIVNLKAFSDTEKRRDLTTGLQQESEDEIAILDQRRDDLDALTQEVAELE